MRPSATDSTPRHEDQRGRDSAEHVHEGAEPSLHPGALDADLQPLGAARLDPVVLEALGAERLDDLHRRQRLGGQ